MVGGGGNPLDLLVLRLVPPGYPPLLDFRPRGDAGGSGRWDMVVVDLSGEDAVSC